MPKSYLRCLTIVTFLTFIYSNSWAESKAKGLISIWKGHIDAPPTYGFVGTGFHIGDGFVVTAKHVLDALEEEWFGIVASYNAVGNRVRRVSDPTCFDEADVCFFRLDPTDASIRNNELAMPYGISCELPPKPLPLAEMTGFSAETRQEKHFPNIHVQGSTATFEAPGGIIFDKYIQTNAHTSPGTSGSPVVFQGSRNAFGIHVAYSQSTNDQIIFPFYALKRSKQIDGIVLFDPDKCAAGKFEVKTQADPQDKKPQVVVQAVTMGAAGECIEFAFSNLSENFKLGKIELAISEIDGPNTISAGDNSAVPLSQTYNLPLPGSIFISDLPIAIPFRAPYSASQSGDFYYVDVCPLLPQDQTSATFKFKPKFFAPDTKQISDMRILSSTGEILDDELTFEARFDKNLVPSIDEARFRIQPVDQPGLASLRKVIEVLQTKETSPSIRMSVVDLLNEAIEATLGSDAPKLSYELNSEDLEALEVLVGFPAEDDLLRYLLLRKPSVTDDFGFGQFIAQRYIPELDGDRIVILHSSPPYLGVPEQAASFSVLPKDDPVSYLNSDQCANTRKINLSALPELVLAAKAARAAEYLGENHKPYAFIVALRAINKAFSADKEGLANALQKITRETKAALNTADPSDAVLIKEKNDLDGELAELFFRAGYFEIALQEFEKRASIDRANGTTDIQTLFGVLDASIALNRDPTLILNQIDELIANNEASDDEIIRFALLSQVVDKIVDNSVQSNRWRETVNARLGSHPWNNPDKSKLSIETNFLWAMALARRPDIATPFLLNRLRQMREFGETERERAYLMRLAPFVGELFGLISFKPNANGRYVHKETLGYPNYLDFLHNQPFGAARCKVTQAGQVVISDGSFVSYGSTNPEEDFATTLAGYGVLTNRPADSLLPNTPKERQSAMVAQLEKWVVQALERTEPEPSAVPFMKLVAIEWFAAAFASWEPVDPSKPSFTYRAGSASELSDPINVTNVAGLPFVTLEQKRLLSLFLETYQTLSDLYR